MGRWVLGNGPIRKLYSPSQLTAATAQTLPKAVYTVHCTQLTDGRSSNKCGSLIYTRYVRSYAKSCLKGRPDSHASGFTAKYSINCVGVGERSSCLPPSGWPGSLACSRPWMCLQSLCWAPTIWKDSAFCIFQKMTQKAGQNSASCQLAFFKKAPPLTTFMIS